MLFFTFLCTFLLKPTTPIEPCAWTNKLFMEIWPNYFEPKLSRTLFSTVEVNILSLTKHIWCACLLNFSNCHLLSVVLEIGSISRVSCRGQNIAFVPLNTCMSNKEYNILWFQIISIIKLLLSFLSLYKRWRNEY